jgi:hypothetical protein
MIDSGTCPVCGRERVHLNVMTGKLIRHTRLEGNQYRRCPGSNTPPAGSRAVD